MFKKLFLLQYALELLHKSLLHDSNCNINCNTETLNVNKDLILQTRSDTKC